MGLLDSIGVWWARLSGRELAAVEAVPVGRANDGLAAMPYGPVGANDRDYADMQSQYTDALDAWRKNPQARRIIDITTDHVLGDGLRPVASGQLGRFLDLFWRHRQNRMDMRLPAIVDELSRAGDVFIAMFRNPQDGMSYIRPIPKSQIIKIEVADNDWETEIAYHERQGPGEEPRRWLSPMHPDAGAADAIMCHYAINRPVGALWGEGDLATITPWLLRYSRMLEDRVRLNWAARAMHWFVKVPKSAVAATRAKYSNNPPSPGAIIVHDDGEEWDMRTPNLGASDAANDLQALRIMIAVGAGQPPHWHGDSMDVNLATATAMERTAVRHLKRRQQEVADMVIDLCHIAYSRAHTLGAARRIPNRDAITISLPDLSRDDNVMLAQAGGELAAAFNGLMTGVGSGSRSLKERLLRLFFQFIAEPIDEEDIGAILDELDEARAAMPVFAPQDADEGDEEETEEAEPDDALSAIGRIRRNGHGT
jgi:hypothetical protein